MRGLSASACKARAPHRGPKPSAGYTYVGLLVLIATMGVTLTAVSELMSTAQKRDKEQELLFIGNQFRQALARYNANGGGSPRRLEDLLKDPRIPGTRRFLRTIYRDPMTGRAEWGLVKTGDFITGVHSLSGGEPLKKAQFSLADQAFEGKRKYSEWVFFPAASSATSRPSVSVPQPRPGAK